MDRRVYSNQKQWGFLMKIGMLCLFMLLLQHPYAQCDSCRVASKVWNTWGTKNICGIPWTAEGDGGYFGTGSNGRGQQFGSSSYPCSYLTLTGTPTDCDIQQVTVYTSGGSGVNAVLTVSVGGVPFLFHGFEGVYIGSSDAAYVFTGLGHGEIEINWFQSSSKAIFFAGYSVCCSSIPSQQESMIVCDSATWRGKHLYESGYYRDTVYAGGEIDSIYVLNLQVLPSPTLSFEEPLQTCAGHEIEINSITNCSGSQIFYEDFSAFENECGDQAAKMIDGGPCENPWTLGGGNVNDNLPTFVDCGRVYKAGGKIKMGRTSNTPHFGYIKTVAGLDLSTPFTVTLRAKGWGVSDTVPELPKQSLLKVEVGGVSQILPVDGYKPWPGTYSDYVYHFSGTTANQITISTVDSLTFDPRVFLDFMLVTKDDACQYLWDNGATTPSITVAPTQNTMYHLTVTDLHNCSRTDSVLVNVSTVMGDEYIESCTGIDWYEYSNISESCDYLTHTFENGSVNGCDSVVTLHFTMFPSDTTVLNVQGCGSFEWNGQTYTQSTEEIGEFLSVHDCDSIVRLNLTIHEPTTYTDVQTACDSYTWIDGNTYTESTNTPTIVLTNAAGCDSTVTLHLTVYNAKESEFSETACDSYAWNGQTYTESGDYTQTFRTADGCDSTVTLHLTINEPTTYIDVQTACSAYTWMDGNTYTESTNTPTITLTNAAGCDSVVTLHLTINEPTEETTYATVLENELPYVLNGVEYAESGTYEQHLTSAEGCDSTLTLVLTVVENSTTLLEETICSEDLPYEWNGIEFTGAGERRVTLTSVSGADSVVVMMLTVNQPTSQTMQVAVVENNLPYVLNGIEYEESGIYTQHLTNAAGCDSTLSIVLTVNENSFTQVYDTICDRDFPYIWNGIDFRSSGDGEVTLHASDGTDSVVVMHLTVYFADNVVVPLNACDSYTWNDQTYFEGGVYTQTFTNVHGCDSIVTMILNITHHVDTTITLNLVDTRLPMDTLGFHLAAAGTLVDTLVNEYGCDSVVTLIVNVYHALTASVSSTINTVCNGNGCEYEGPTILINEVMLSPSSNDGSIAGTDYSRRGEWIELYNPNKCESADISCFFLGNNASDGFNYGGGYVFPPGTVVPPQGFCVVRGSNAPAIPSSRLVENGGNVVEIIVSERYCLGGGSRLWFPNNGGWFAFYNENGVPQDAISWGNGMNSCMSCTPCVPSVNDCGFSGTLSSYANIPVQNKNYISSVNPETYRGMSFRRVPDGGAWLAIPSSPTYGACNADCVPPAVITCNGTATVNVGGGHPPYTYEWSDAQLQTTPTAVGLCAGIYTVTVSDAAGDSLVLQVEVENFVPEVTHPDLEMCTAPTLLLSGGYPSGGEYSGAYVEQNQLLIEDDIQNYTAVYTYTDSNGCVADTMFNIHVKQLSQFDTTVAACDSYTWNNDTYTASGDYTWTGVAVNGCDSTVTLHLTINNAQTSEFSDSACDRYTWNGETYTTSGNYTQTFQTVHGCDSTVTLHLTINNAQTSAFSASACDSYTWNGQTYTTSGDYTWTGVTSNGCDSVVTLHLTIHPENATEFSAISCVNYEWNGQTYTQSGNYMQTFENVYGCDSVVTLHLTIHPENATEYSATACVNYEWNGQTYAQSGDYTQTFENVHGCDSVVTLHLTIYSENATEYSATACVSYEWNDSLYTQSGDYTQSFENVHGCDSVVTLHLTIFDAKFTEYSETACDSYEWNGETYTVSGDYVQEFQSMEGCDSTVTLHLTINNALTTEFAETVCGGYEWHGEIHTTSGDYTWTGVTVNGCDSVVTLHLTVYPRYNIDFDVEACNSYIWNDQVYMTTGRYVQNFTSVNGCDSVVTLNLTVIDTAVSIISSSLDFCDTWSTDLQVVSEMTDYQWSSGEVSDVLHVEAPGIYSVTVSQGDCKGTATYEIEYCEFRLYFPNAITPSNHDGLNDVFEIPEFSQKMIQSAKVYFYNRWGELVYHSEDKSFKWDGSYKGEVFHNVIYNYVIYCTDLQGRQYMYKGSLTVL